MGKRREARELALRILYQTDILKINPEDALQTAVKFDGFAGEVLEFGRRLIIGTWANKKFIDRIIESCSENWRLARMPAIDRNILRFCIFEILFLPDIPVKVTINEGVELGRIYSTENSGKFINGILDRVHRERDKFINKYRLTREG